MPKTAIVIADCGTRERIVAMAPEVKRCLQTNYNVVIVTHLGRPDGKYVPELSTVTIVPDIAAAIGIDVEYILQAEDYETTTLQHAASCLQCGEARAIILQNARMDPRDQSKNSLERASFAWQIFHEFMPELVVWDNLPTAHRLEAYTCELAEIARRNGVHVRIGKDIPAELGGIDSFLKMLREQKHIVGIFGGTKKKEKLPLTEFFYNNFPNSFVAATGSWAEAYTPTVDIFVATTEAGDIDRQSVDRIVAEIDAADAIMHCGTPGNITDGYTEGTYAIWSAILKAIVERSVPVLICGGDTVTEFIEFAKSWKINPQQLKELMESCGGHLSNFGGAAVAHIKGDHMPGLHACHYYK